MATRFANIVGGTVEVLVRWVVAPVTGVIPVLVSSGILFVVFGALWLAVAAGLVSNGAALGDTSRAIGQLPLPVQGALWLLFLPVVAGLWIWSSDWPLALRLVLMVGLAGWNLLVFLPHPGRTAKPALQA